MSQPVIFVIDGDARVTAALREDLDRRFGEDFRVIGESSADSGLAALRKLADEGELVALLIVDHDLSAMPGVEFLARAHEMHPLAKRVLLVERDYSARSPVISAMTLGQADYHLAKPWVLEQDLYRLISEFLAEWAKDHQAGFDLFQVVGLADRDTHELRELLTRFGVPFRFHSVGSRRGRQLLRDGHLDAGRGPVMIRHDGYTIVAPTLAQVVESTGGSISCEVDHCDVAIVGAGPAGLAAAVYAAAEARAMEGRDVFVVGAGNSGGQTALHLARYARRVTMLVRGDSLARSMSEYLIREIEATGNITVRLGTEISDGHGTDHLEALTLCDRRSGRPERVPATALFVLIGGEPRTQWLPEAVQRRWGYIVTGRDVARGGQQWPLDRAPLL